VAERKRHWVNLKREPLSAASTETLVAGREGRRLRKGNNEVRSHLSALRQYIFSRPKMTRGRRASKKDKRRLESTRLTGGKKKGKERSREVRQLK